jgi:acyl dehydratase
MGEPIAFTVGQMLPELVRGPITRGTLALFAGASHDHMLLHIDSDYARAAGMDDVFSHGMLSMAYLAQAMKSWVLPDRLRHWNTRFTAITPLGAVITCRGEVVEISETADGRCARVRIGAWTDRDVQTLDGEAVFSID